MTVSNKLPPDFRWQEDRDEFTLFLDSHPLVKVKYLSWTVDLTLLTAALMLLTILPAAMYSNGWLIVKMVALAFFVACRQFMISDQPPGLPRWGWFLLGAIVLGYAYSVARAHHPLGFFSDLK